MIQRPRGSFASLISAQDESALLAGFESADGA